MFLGHFAAGLAARRVYPQASLGAWFMAVQLPDLIWPVLLLAGLEHVRIVPGITAFTPLDFYDYPISHSLVAVVGWGAAFGTMWAFGSRTGRTARGRVPAALAAGVISHWVLDALAHRPDVPVLPNGPYLGLGVWHSVAATLAVELSLFAGAVVLFAMGAPEVARRRSFVALMAVLLIGYAGAALGPPPPDVNTLAVSALAVWLLVLWAKYADRR